MEPTAKEGHFHLYVTIDHRDSEHFHPRGATATATTTKTAPLIFLMATPTRR